MRKIFWLVRSRTAAFWNKAETVWNESMFIAWTLAVSGLSLAAWAGFYPQSPGVSVGMLALAAGIMSIRPKMHPAEKTVWVIVLVAFTFFEVHAIKRSDESNKKSRDAQNGTFSAIVDRLDQSLALSKGNYDSTISHVDEVLQTTQDVGKLARQNLLEATGGDSFAYVYPVVAKGTNLAQLSIHNDGDEILSSVVVTIRYLVGGSIEPGYKGPAHFAGHNAINIGPLAAHEGRTVPSPDGRIDLGRLEEISPTRTIRIWINAQNAGVQENLYLRNNSGEWEYRLIAKRIIPKQKRRKGDVLVDGQWVRTLKNIDWTRAVKPQP